MRFLPSTTVSKGGPGRSPTGAYSDGRDRESRQSRATVAVSRPCLASSAVAPIMPAEVSHGGSPHLLAIPAPKRHEWASLPIGR